MEKQGDIEALEKGVWDLAKADVERRRAEVEKEIERIALETQRKLEVETTRDVEFQTEVVRGEKEAAASVPLEKARKLSIFLEKSLEAAWSFFWSSLSVEEEKALLARQLAPAAAWTKGLRVRAVLRSYGDVSWVAPFLSGAAEIKVEILPCLDPCDRGIVLYDVDRRWTWNLRMRDKEAEMSEIWRGELVEALFPSGLP